ncbi:TPA: TraI/MobA(P) family conjugative relaxase [Legionella pneumophila]
MIVRHIPMRSIRKSSFSGLIRYMTHEHGLQERVGAVSVSNCQSHDIQWAVHEVEAVQSLNQRTQSDKTYHLLISFPAGEVPADDVLKDIEARLCASIGLGGHQRVSVVHYDTDHVHIHVGINKIHPTRNTLHEPFMAYKKLGETATALEIEYGLQRVNHKAFKVGAENRADDMEHHSGIGSLLNWIKSTCMSRLQAAQSWSAFHQVLQEHGLELHARGNGFVFVDGSGFGVKASSVARDFSKVRLEQKFGSFVPKSGDRKGFKIPKAKKSRLNGISLQPPAFARQRHRYLHELQCLTMDNGLRYVLKPVAMRTNQDDIYARYVAEQHQIKQVCMESLSRALHNKSLRIESAKRHGALKRAAIKLLQGSGVPKKVLYALVHQSVQQRIDDAKKQYRIDRDVIYRNHQRSTFADWLKQKALEGDKHALEALRSRASRQPLKGNLLQGKPDTIRPSDVGLRLDNITKTGTEIYRVGTTAIRDDGKRINVSRGSCEEGLLAALQLAIQRYGSCISVQGSDIFKEQIVETAVKLKLNIRFDDANLELQRQQLTSNLNKKDNHHESRRNSGSQRGSTNRSSDERARTRQSIPYQRNARTHAASGLSSKPHLGRIGHHPPPEGNNRLRNLSELGVVLLSSRSEVLLSRDVSRHMDDQRTESDNRMRRHVSWAGALAFVSEAADKYIAERELKRQRIANIPKHRRFSQTDRGFAQFAGLRVIDGSPLALLRRDDVILVLPIDGDTAKRMKGLSLGDTVKTTSKGVVLSRGRSR